MIHLRDRITLQHVTKTQDDFGEPVETWATLATVWSRVLPGSANESQVNGTTKTASEYTVELWYRSDLTVQDRVKFGSLYLSIDGLANVDGLNRKILLTCTETS